MAGLESLAISTAAKHLGNIHFPTFEKIANISIDDTIKQRFFLALNKYFDTYNQRHGILKVLGMRQPVSLDDIYTTVQLLSERESLIFANITDLEESFRKSNKERFRFDDEKVNKKSGIEVANNEQYLMVLGAPGAGKSTFLRKTGLEALKGKDCQYNHQVIPVFLELKRFTNPEIDITNLIVQEFEICGFPEAENFTQNSLNNGKLLILFDGIDEIPTDNLDNVITAIEDFVDRYYQNRFIASCRVAAYKGGFRRFTNVVMADFDDGQIEQFIYNWFNSEEDKIANIAEKCWQLLKEDRNQAARELAKTPLLLTFLCLVYDKSQNLPSNRSELYSDALRILLKEWKAEKRIKKEDIYEGLNPQLEEILLSEIAYQSFTEDRLFFHQQDIIKQIKTFLADNLNAPQHLDGEKVLNAIAIQQGILVERARNIYSFSHLTLQEYLTAQYIVDNQRYEELVTNHLTDTKWKEVFLLVAGLMRGGADSLLNLMEKQALNYLETPVGKQKLIPLLQWGVAITKDSQGDLSPVAKRNVAIAYAYANAIAYANANAIGYANPYTYAYTYAEAYITAHSYGHVYAYTNAIAYAEVYAIPYTNPYTSPIGYAITQFIKTSLELDKLPEVFTNVNFKQLIEKLEALEQKIPEKNQPKEKHRKFTQDLINLWLKAFNLTAELVNITEEELDEMNEQYFYIYWLMLQCKDSAVRVSPTTWSDIEDRMLLPPS